MGRFLNGMFIGAGIALLVAPMRGEDMRRLLRERFNEIRGSLPASDQVQQAGQQFVSSVKESARPMTNAVKESARPATDAVKQSARQAMQKGQGLSGAAAHETQTGGSTNAPFPSAYPSYVNPEQSNT